MEFAKEAKEKFLTGTLGKSFSEKLINFLLKKVNKRNSYDGVFNFMFTQGAYDNDACIVVSIRIIAKHVLDNETKTRGVI